MTTLDQQEFWVALGRLYETTVNLKDSIESLSKVAQAHESRLDKLEVVQLWLVEEAKRKRQ